MEWNSRVILPWAKTSVNKSRIPSLPKNNPYVDAVWGINLNLFIPSAKVSIGNSTPPLRCSVFFCAASSRADYVPNKKTRIIAMSDSVKTETTILISDGDQIVQQTTWIFRQLKQKDDGLSPPTEWAKPLDIKAFCHFHMFTKFKIRFLLYTEIFHRKISTTMKFNSKGLFERILKRRRTSMLFVRLNISMISFRFIFAAENPFLHRWV